MTKAKKTFLIVAAAVVPVIAAVLLLLFSGPKHNPWELTYAIVPNDVTAAYVWSEGNDYTSIHLSEDEITEAVHLINQLEKADFRENSSHAGTTPEYYLELHFGGIKLMIAQVGGTKTEMNFDNGTAESLFTDQWIVDDAALAAFLLEISGFAT